MSKRSSRVSVLAAAAFGAALVLQSCTCTIKEEQQAMINSLRADEAQLNTSITAAEADRAKISKELRGRQKEVQACSQKKAFVQDKLNAWPTIGPDWTPTTTGQGGQP